MNKKFFSLIELLVVIAMVVLLASIIQPSLQKAIEFSRQTACANNLKRIAIGVFWYNEDENSVMPVLTYHRNQSYTGTTANYPNNIPSSENALRTIDRKYIGQKSQFLCPNDDFVDPNDPYRNFESSYGLPSKYSKTSIFSHYYWSYEDEDLYYQKRFYHDFLKPEKYLMAADAGHIPNHPNPNIAKKYYSWLKLRPGESGFTYIGSVSAKHQMGTNFVALDGHVEWELVEVVQVKKDQDGKYAYWWESH